MLLNEHREGEILYHLSLCEHPSCTTIVWRSRPFTSSILGNGGGKGLGTVVLMTSSSARFWR